jgi:hypothetical protein
VESASRKTEKTDMTKNDVIDLLVRCVERATMESGLRIQPSELVSALQAEREKEEAWKPTKNKKYWWINQEGQVFDEIWDNDDVDNLRRDFTGVYRSEAEAKETVDAIRKFVKERRGI